MRHRCGLKGVGESENDGFRPGTSVSQVSQKIFRVSRRLMIETRISRGIF